MKIGIVGKSRYIDAEALIEQLNSCSYNTWSKDINRTWWAQAVKVKDNVVECIERQPTADVVEVVRCCECKYCEIVIHSIIDEPKWFCTRMVRSFDVDPTSFCSYGERREK